MAFRPDYLLRETGQNLLRNPSLSLATILTVFISLSLMGVALLFQSGIDRLNNVFQGEVEFIVWMDQAAGPTQIDGVQDQLDSNQFIRESWYIGKDETWVEFQQFYADRPEILELLDRDQMPTSFQVAPENTAVANIEGLSAELETLDGVTDVQFASEAIENIARFSRVTSLSMLVAAIAAGVASALLMYNSIRTAVFARRREIEVMRLVGATKWFIRIPFMLEGLVQGVVGAFLSVFSVFALNQVFDNLFASFNSLTFNNVALSFGQIVVIGAWLMVIGALIGAVGAGVAVTRYLDA